MKIITISVRKLLIHKMRQVLVRLALLIPCYLLGVAVNCRNAPTNEHLTLRDLSDVDKVLPVITPLNFTDNFNISADFAFSGTATDANGIKIVEGNLDNSGWVSVTGTGTWIYNQSVSNLSVGPHSLQFRATDKAGNSVTNSYNITYLPILYVRTSDGVDTNTGIITSPLKTITKAITLSAQKNVPEIRVALGTYSEVITISHDVRIKGSYDTNFTVQDRALYLSTLTHTTYLSNVTISGSTVSNKMELNGFRINGSTRAENSLNGLLILGGAKPTIKNNYIFGATNTQAGAAVYSVFIESGATPLIIGNTIEGGSSLSREAAIYVIFGGSGVVANNVIITSAPVEAYGIAVQDTSEIIAVNNTLRISGASGFSAGIALDNASNSATVIANNIIEVVGGGMGIVNKQNAAPGIFSNNILIAPNRYCLGASPGSNCSSGTVLDPSTVGGANAIIAAGATTVVGNLSPGGTITSLVVSTSDFHLLAGSLAIDAGRNSSTTAYGTILTDLAGTSRGYNDGAMANFDTSAYDIGAYEWTP